MADVSQIRSNPTPQYTPGAATPPPQAPPQQAPPAASDRVTLNQGEGPGYAYKHEQDGQGVQYQTWAARSGVKYEVATREDETRFHVEIPQGVSPAPLELSGGTSAGQPAQMVAHVAGSPDQQLPVQQTPDGKYLIGMGPSGAVAMFDPQTMDFGLSTAAVPQLGPNGQPMTYQALQQTVHADASQTVKAHATTGNTAQGGMMGQMMGIPGMGVSAPAQEMRYLQIDESATGQVTAKQVVERQGSEVPSGMFGKIEKAMGAPAREETAVQATRQADGSYAVTGSSSLMSHMKASLSNPFALQSPLLNWMKAKKEPAAIIQTFQSNPSLLASAGAAAGPMAAMGMAAPFAQGAAVPPPPGFFR